MGWANLNLSVSLLGPQERAGKCLGLLGHRTLGVGWQEETGQGQSICEGSPKFVLSTASFACLESQVADVDIICLQLLGSNPASLVGFCYLQTTHLTFSGPQLILAQARARAL